MKKGNLFQESVYVNEIDVKLRRVKLGESEQKYPSKTIKYPEDIFNSFKFLFQDSPVELFVVIHLKTSNEVSGYETVTKGLLNQTLVHPREVYRSAILRNAASIVICHNHPSGNIQPSQEDISMTKQIVDSGKILGIPCQDHIIFGYEKYYSFVESGRI